MTKIKFCGITRLEDVETVNVLRPDYIGFVFVKESKRYVNSKEAEILKRALAPGIQAVGVFVNEAVETVVDLLEHGIIDVAQLHGDEDETYINALRRRSKAPIIQAFRIHSEEDVKRAVLSSADDILLDAGAGAGEVFDWTLLKNMERPYFLAGGLSLENIELAIKILHPYALDVSSGIETNGKKDADKMAAFTAKVRKVGTQ